MSIFFTRRHIIDSGSVYNSSEIGSNLADADEFLIYDESAGEIKKSLFSRVWTYIGSKLPNYTGTIGGTTLTLETKTLTVKNIAANELIQAIQFGALM